MGEDNIFAAAAVRLEANQTNWREDGTGAAQLIDVLGYDPTSAGDERLIEHRVKLLRIASRFTRFFRLTSRWAPGLSFAGAQIVTDGARSGRATVQPVNFSGAGCGFSDAFQACVGEASEYLSQVEVGFASGGPLSAISNRERPRTSTTELLVARLGVTTAELADADWLPATTLTGTTSTLAPADLCLRTTAANRQRSPLVALSEGVAAGVTLEAATQRALLEVIERDAAALWWIGGRPAKCFEPAQLEQSGVPTFLEDIRRGDRTRTVHILDITSDLDVPCIAAWSMRADGRNFACGLAARARAEDAIRAALIEMSAMELNYELQPDPVPDAFREEPTTLSEASRYGDIRSIPAGTLAGHERSPLTFSTELRPTGPEFTLLVRRLETAGFDALVVNLTRTHIGIPVAKVLIPSLQPLTPRVTTPRLLQVLDERGGGDLQRRGWGLMPT